MSGPGRAAHCLAALLWAVALSGGALGGQIPQNPYVSESAYAVQSAAAPSAFSEAGKPANGATLNCSNANACLAMCPAHSFLEPTESGARPSSKRIAQQARSIAQLFARVWVTKHLRRQQAVCRQPLCLCNIPGVLRRAKLVMTTPLLALAQRAQVGTVCEAGIAGMFGESRLSHTYMLCSLQQA